MLRSETTRSLPGGVELHSDLTPIKAWWLFCAVGNCLQFCNSAVIVVYGATRRVLILGKLGFVFFNFFAVEHIIDRSAHVQISLSEHICGMQIHVKSF